MTLLVHFSAVLKNGSDLGQRLAVEIGRQGTYL